jgi:ankyrin repeat protein
MEKNRYISGMKVLFSTALILSTIEQSSSIASLSNVNAVDAEGFTLLHHAAAGLGSTGEVRSLVVERGANIHLRDGRGLTALHHAVLSGNVDTVN